MKINIKTLGCRANQYDSEAIRDMVASNDVQIVKNEADVFIVNTCTVTNGADSEARKLIRKIKRDNPKSKIIVTGCYAQTSPDELIEMEEVTHVVGNGSRHLIDDILKGLYNDNDYKDKIVKAKDENPFKIRVKTQEGKTRVNLKIQDGCHRPCTFCIIPVARGEVKSLEKEKIIQEIKNFESQSFKEIVLTGIHIGSYGKDFKKKYNLLTLLKEIEKENFNLRLRLSSLDPDEVTGDMIEFLKHSKTFCKYLHLPIQSGSDKILKLMKRPYRATVFKDLILKLNKEIPGISIGTDIIAGFPNETDSDFEESYNLLKDLPLSYLHVFPYSDRRGTEASEMGDKIKGDVIKGRVRKLLDLDMELRDNYFEKVKDKEVLVLTEKVRSKKENMLKGKTESFLTVFFEGNDHMKNNFTKLKLIKPFKDDGKSYLGEICH